MGIVLNEYEAACGAIRERRLGNRPTETLRRVAGLMREDNEQLTKKQVRKRLEMFLLRCVPDASLQKWNGSITFAVNGAFKRGLIKIDSLVITKPEMVRIDSLEGRQVRRLAFVLLCLAKYWDAANPSNDHWTNSRDAEIMKMANISTSLRRQCIMYATLKEEGLIDLPKKIDSTNARVLFIEDGDPAITITDLRNLGYQYLMSHGEPYFECQNCGIVTKYNSPEKGRGQKYCRDCATEIRMRQNIDSVLRKRTANKT